MAASTYTITLKNGQSLSVYQASGRAVNRLTGPAASTTTTTDFTPNTDTCIEDIVVAAALTAGGIEVYNVSRSMRSGKIIGDLSPYLATNTTRRPPRICFHAGQVYRLIQIVAGNA